MSNIEHIKQLLATIRKFPVAYDCTEPATTQSNHAPNSSCTAPIDLDGIEDDDSIEFFGTL